MEKSFAGSSPALPTNFKLNQMEQTNYVEILNSMEISDAKKLLKKHGYFVDNLWHTCDVTDVWECTNEQAQELLYKALTSESTIEQIHIAVCFIAEDMNLKELS